MLRDEVLALLKAREGKPLSGEEMSRALGVSRAAVWKLSLIHISATCA